MRAHTRAGGPVCTVFLLGQLEGFEWRKSTIRCQICVRGAAAGGPEWMSLCPGTWEELAVGIRPSRGYGDGGRRESERV